MKRALKRQLVAPRRHTGQVLPRTSTSYPLLVMIILLVGVLIFSWSAVVSAGFPGPITNSYTVSTRYPAPLPTEAATIDNPTNGQRFSQQPITVSGSCPTNSYIELMRNGFFSGVALCDVNGKYQLSTDLFIGNNKLQAQVYNITGDAGPSGSAVSVNYQPPAPVATAQPVSSSGQSTAPALPLLLKTNFTYQGYYAGQPTEWQFDLSGGSGPYAVNVDWGDGHSNLLSVAQAGGFTLYHTYTKTGGYRGSYVVKVSVSDLAGNQGMLQLLSIINSPNPNTAASSRQVCLNNGDCTANSQTVSGGIRKLAWSGYGVSVLMLVSFWLGERHELYFLKLRRNKTKHA